MGIINVTPDSFYEGSRLSGVNDILHQAEKMLNEGAAFLDIGAQSTRPGNKEVGIDEELNRLLLTIESVSKHFPSAVISVDTYHSAVATRAVAAGASIINDISGGNADPLMFETVGRMGVPYVCMHIVGVPATMHEPAVYQDITVEVMDHFITRMEACRLAGIRDLILDPGFGFSKRTNQNFELLNNLSLLKTLGKPLLVGLSRKSTISKTLGVATADALNGTTVMNTIALLQQADILRVHDVKEAMEAIRLVGELR